MRNLNNEHGDGSQKQREVEEAFIPSNQLYGLWKEENKRGHGPLGQQQCNEES